MIATAAPNKNATSHVLFLLLSIDLSRMGAFGYWGLRAKFTRMRDSNAFDFFGVRFAAPNSVRNERAANENNKASNDAPQACYGGPRYNSCRSANDSARCWEGIAYLPKA
jgi:hypothetical protein